MKEYINYKELFEIAYELINKELDLGVDNKDRYHHLSMNTNMYENTIDVYMVDCVALDEEEHFYLLSSTYEMDFKDRMIFLLTGRFNTKKFYEGMREDNCVKEYFKQEFDVKRLTK